MGKATRWLRSLILSKKSPDSNPPAKQRTSKTKWGFTNSSGTSIKFRSNVQDPLATPYADELDASKHAIAVAAATAAVAEAALAAAQAAAEVVRLTSSGASGRNSSDRRPVAAAIKIQSAFRAYLARRALRALKALVKLQALVRGHIVRKQSANMLRRMQAMARIQARASAHRCYTPEYCNGRNMLTKSNRPGNTNIGKYEGRSNTAKNGGSLSKQIHLRSPMGNGGGSQIASRWLNNWMDDSTWNSLIDTCPEDRLVDDERVDKILEIDTWKPRQNTGRSAKTTPTSHCFSAWKDQNQNYSKSHPSSRLPNPSISSEEISSAISAKIPHEGDHVSTWTAANSPRLHSAPSRPGNKPRGPFSPARSECSKSFFGDYISHPGYMANTESSRAKARSLSAPKQRLLIEETGWNAKFGHGLSETDTISEMGLDYSSRVKRQGSRMPSRDTGSGFGRLYGHRH